MDPPQRAHAWIATFRGAFITASLYVAGLLAVAVAHRDPHPLSTAPERAWYALGLTMLAYGGLAALVHVFVRDPRKEVIERIRKTWDQPKPR